jgi:DUF4097 and DUF4098 domain-containing protein YvlB
MPRLLSLTIALLALAVVAGCTQPYKAARSVTETIEHLTDAPINIETRNGGVEIIAGSEDNRVTINATLRCVGNSQSEADDRVQHARLEFGRDTSRTLQIKPVFPGEPRSNDGCSIVVRVPDARDITIRASNGSIRVSDTAGNLAARSSNGTITVTEHDGPVDLHTSNGTVEAISVGAPATIDTSNGRIVLALRPDHVGTIDLDTSNGSVDVTVPAAIRGRITMNTSNGRVHVFDPTGAAIEQTIDRTRGQIVFTTDGPRSKVSTSNGSISVTIEDEE